MGTAFQTARMRVLKLTSDGGGLLHRLDVAAAIAPQKTELVFSCKLVTPALLGGADPRAPDADQPVRIKDIRGKMRLWWRVLANAGDLDAELAAWRASRPELETHRAVEDFVWGSIHGAAPHRGLISLALDADPNQQIVLTPYETAYRAPGEHRERRQPTKSLVGYRYALEFAKAAARGTIAETRLLLGVGYTFRVKVTLAEQALQAAVLKVVWAWMRFSGVGSRTSRGIGSVLVEPLNPGLAFPPQKLAAATRLNVGEFATAEAAVQWGLKMLQAFCQGQIGRNGLMGRSKWPEADTIRRIAATHYDAGDGRHIHDPNYGLAGRVNTFPRLALGHRTIRFHPDQTNGPRRNFATPDPEEHVLVPAGADRLPSSLLIRPVRAPDQHRTGTDWVCMLVQLTHLSQAVRSMQIPVNGLSGEVEVPVWRESWRAGIVGGCDGVSALEGNPMVAYQPGERGPKNPKDAAQVFMNYALNAWNEYGPKGPI